MAHSKQVDTVHAQSVVPCNVCDDEEPGQRYCIECKQTLCTKCAKSHRKVASTKDHSIILRTQIGEIESEVLICIDHTEPASVHCEKCNVPICIQCVTGTHQGHKMVQLTEIVQEKKQFLQRNIDELKKDVLPELLRNKSEIAEKREKYEQSFQEHINGVEKEKDELLRGLQRVYKENLKSLHDTRVSDLQIYDKSTRDIDTKIQFYEKRISEYQDIIKTKNFSSIINFRFERDPVQDLIGEPELPRRQKFVASNIENIIESVKNLRTDYSLPVPKTPSRRSPVFISTFKSPSEGATSIAITNDGCVWLGGSDDKELLMVNIVGETLNKRKIQNKPNGLAVTDHGQLIISTHCQAPVKIMMTDGREYNLIEPCSTFGVSVTPDQRILICSQGGNVVRINKDGTNLNEVYDSSGLYSTYHAIENADGKTFISDRRNSKVVVIDKDGSIVSKLKKTSSGEKLRKPTGLVLDKKGNILFADKGNDCVYIIDQNQQVRELVGRSHGIRNPRFLAFDDKGHLWITSFNETITIVKFLEEY